MPHAQVLTMLTKITNFGRPRTFPTPKGYVFIAVRKPYYTDNAKVLEILQTANKRRDVFLKIETLDYTKYKIYELRSMAAKVGIEGFFTMKKSDLIKKLEEKHGTR